MHTMSMPGGCCRSCAMAGSTKVAASVSVVATRMVPASCSSVPAMRRSMVCAACSMASAGPISASPAGVSTNAVDVRRNSLADNSPSSAATRRPTVA